MRAAARALLTTMVAALSLAVVAAMSVAAAEDVRGVNGRWYMDGEENGRYIQYLVDRSDDGTFKAEIKVPGDCSSAKSWIETGRWSFRDGTLHTRTETVDGVAVDPDDEEFQDAFVITVIDDDHVTAYDVETKITWSPRRVGLDFTFPLDAACSI